MRRNGRRVLALAVVVALGTGVLAGVAGPSSAQVASVVGGATDHFAEVSLFGGTPVRWGPAGTPGCGPDQPVPGPAGSPREGCSISVTLPAAGGSESVADPDRSAVVRYGPAVFYSRGAATVTTQGTTGTAGSVTSSAEIQNVNASGREVFTAASMSSTCSASETGITASTTITGGTLQTSEGNPDLPGDETVITLPTNPAVNEAHAGALEVVGDTFEYRFNEQVSNADGSLTVYAAHLVLLGPTAVGDLYIGRVDCAWREAGPRPPSAGRRPPRPLGCVPPPPRPLSPRPPAGTVLPSGGLFGERTWSAVPT